MDKNEKMILAFMVQFGVTNKHITSNQVLQESFGLSDGVFTEAKNSLLEKDLIIDSHRLSVLSLTTNGILEAQKIVIECQFRGLAD